MSMRRGMGGGAPHALDRNLHDAARRGASADGDECAYLPDCSARASRIVSEAQALLRYIDGESYQDIARALGRQVKQIDNALQRAKKKLMRRAQGRLTQDPGSSAQAGTPT